MKAVDVVDDVWLRSSRVKSGHTRFASVSTSRLRKVSFYTCLRSLRLGGSAMQGRIRRPACMHPEIKDYELSMDTFKKAKHVLTVSVAGCFQVSIAANVVVATSLFCCLSSSQFAISFYSSGDSLGGLQTKLLP